MHARQIHAQKAMTMKHAHKTHTQEVIAEEPEIKSVIKDELFQELERRGR